MRGVRAGEWSFVNLIRLSYCNNYTLWRINQLLSRNSTAQFNGAIIFHTYLNNAGFALSSIASQDKVEPHSNAKADTLSAHCQADGRSYAGLQSHHDMEN